MSRHYTFLAIVWQATLTSRLLAFELELTYPSLLPQHPSRVYSQGHLAPQYNDSIYNQGTTCSNGELTIIQFYRNQTDDYIEFRYRGIELEAAQIQVTAKFEIPKAQLAQVDTLNNIIRIDCGCLGEQTNKYNYYNKVDILVVDAQAQTYYPLSLLVGCDRGGRDKKFEVGYVVVMVINTAITIGVALHSRIWSLRFQGRPLSIELKWHRFLITMVVITVLGVVLYMYASDESHNANLLLQVLGLLTSYAFCFVCTNEALFLVPRLKQQIWRRVRWCDVASFVTATGAFIIGFFTSSWIYYDVLAVGICVGAIKLLRFSSMRQALISMLIITLFVSVAAGILHFKLQRSYNDYASELTSPLFIQIPDLIDQLYKKCSWLPIIDIIVPGVFLSFLRCYDQNYNTGWGGVYTVTGNLAFILGTVLWVLLEALYPYSIPFSLITYPFLAASIALLAQKRNEFKTLWEGRFNGANNDINTSKLSLSQGRNSLNSLLPSDVLNSMKIDGQEESQLSEGLNQQLVKS